MHNHEYDAIVRVRFLLPSEGGRRSNLTLLKSGVRYGCPLGVDGRYFDCRVLHEEDRVLALGEVHDLEVVFMNRDRALAAMSEGSPITLWEGRTVAAGEVMKIRRPASSIANDLP